MSLLSKAKEAFLESALSRKVILPAASLLTFATMPSCVAPIGYPPQGMGRPVPAQRGDQGGYGFQGASGPYVSPAAEALIQNRVGRQELSDRMKIARREGDLATYYQLKAQQERLGYQASYLGKVVGYEKKRERDALRAQNDLIQAPARIQNTIRKTIEGNIHRNARQRVNDWFDPY